jgi:hypothetical protein
MYHKSTCKARKSLVDTHIHTTHIHNTCAYNSAFTRIAVTQRRTNPPNTPKNLRTHTHTHTHAHTHNLHSLTHARRVQRSEKADDHLSPVLVFSSGCPSLSLFLRLRATSSINSASFSSSMPHTVHSRSRARTHTYTHNMNLTYAIEFGPHEC